MTATWIVSAGNHVVASPNKIAACRTFCGATLCAMSTIRAAGLIDKITPFISATYGLPKPKSVVRVMIAGMTEVGDQKSEIGVVWASAHRVFVSPSVAY